MEFSIREYKESDREALVECMEKLQEYIAGVDPLKRVLRKPGFGEVYTVWLLNLIAEGNGVIYLAEKGGKIVGCVAGTVSVPAPHEIAGGVSTYGRVHELYVDSDCRGEGIGKALMDKCEDYFRKNGCDVALVEVFEPNKNAHEFYHSCGYADRDINLMKRL